VLLTDVTYPVAFLYGLLSFFSPCILPLIPAYFCFITGMSLEELTAASHGAIRRKILFSTLAFVVGFSLVFILLGASASYLGNVLAAYKNWIRISGGALIIIFGLHLTGLVRIPLFEFEKRLQINQKPLHFLGTVFIGMAFGAGWTPCIGPILGSLLVLAQDKETVGQAVWLLGMYSFGLALPFIGLSIFINFLLGFISRTKKVLRFINPLAGGLLIVIGLLLISNKLQQLSVL
jgi:cytochrome c-type biogenesis protein